MPLPVCWPTTCNYDLYDAAHHPSHRRGAGPGYSGTKTIVAFLILAEEAEVVGKEVVGKPERF